MKTIELLKENPSAFEAMRNWHRNEVLESSKDLPKYFIEMLEKENIDESVIQAITDANPRNWFDFFDSHKIYIDIKADFDGTFRYALLEGTVSELGSLEKFKTRKEADSAAVEAAILSLENKLKLLEKDNKDS
jgi:hypothetical protein